MHVSHAVDSRYAWFRLIVSLVLATIGGCGMYVVVVVLPAVQAEFDVARGAASLPYTMTMIGFGIGGILMGRLTDRFGIAVPVTIGGVAIAAGFVLAAAAGSIWTFGLAYGLLVGMLGSSTTFSPLVTDTSFWFERRRGIAVAICASGNYLAGTVWPPVVQHFVDAVGWRQTFVGIGLFCLFTMVPLAQLLRRRAAPAAHGPAPVGEASVSTAVASGAAAAAPPALPRVVAGASAATPLERLDISSRALLALLCLAGVACCVAMSMPQVHIVAYCGDLGYGPARGAQMLSLMLGFGVISRITFGLICDRIGGLRTLLLGSVLQGVALLLFLPFDSLASLYVISAMFGLFQGGIVPSYAIIVREFFPASGAGMRVGLVITATLFGMALGGWLSGVLFDLTGSYEAAFVHGIAWNAVNVSIVAWLLLRLRRNDRASGVFLTAARS
ncbi:MAG: MFS transporter [Burkholderiaceae bacterium]|nr:MFS transporter [Burkholderiaceae bacterium]